MAEKIQWDSDKVRNFMSNRTLENYFPGLKRHLNASAAVLDVGCGAATITVGVAAMLQTGTLIGVDLAENSVQQAQKLAEELQLHNVTFKAMNTYELQFEDETFDITYSHHVLVWLNDPIKALREQKRVTKRGGKVIAGIGDWGTMVLYPPCPALQAIIAALARLNDPAEPGIFFNPNLGREAMALFSVAGFSEIQVEADVTQLDCTYAGSSFFDDRYNYLKFICDSNPNSSHHSMYQKLLKQGYVDDATYQAAQAEVEQWHNHPHAFQTEVKVMAIGKVT